MKKLTKAQYREIFKQPESSAPALAKTLDKFLKFTFYGLIGVSLFLISFALISLVTGEFSVQQALNLGLLNLHVVESVIPPSDVLMICMILNYSSSLLWVAPACFGIFTVRSKILYPIQKGKTLPPFSKDLKKLGNLFLIFGGLSSLSKYLLESITLTAFSVEELLIGGKITEITYNVTLDLTFLIIFLAFYFLSFVFRYIENTQRQTAEAAAPVEEEK